MQENLKGSSILIVLRQTFIEEYNVIYFQGCLTKIVQSNNSVAYLDRHCGIISMVRSWWTIIYILKARLLSFSFDSSTAALHWLELIIKSGPFWKSHFLSCNLKRVWNFFDWFLDSDEFDQSLLRHLFISQSIVFSCETLLRFAAHCNDCSQWLAAQVQKHFPVTRRIRSHSRLRGKTSEPKCSSAFSEGCPYAERGFCSI